MTPSLTCETIVFGITEGKSHIMQVEVVEAGAETWVIVESDTAHDWPTVRQHLGAAAEGLTTPVGYEPDVDRESGYRFAWGWVFAR